MAKSNTNTNPKPAIKLTNKQKVFCDEYLIDLNATQAAIRAGYSKKTAYAIGWENLRKPEIRTFINNKLSERSLSADETTKLITDIARGNLSDYFTVKKVERAPKIEKSLKIIIEELNAKIEFEKEFAKLAKLEGRELKEHNEFINEMKKDMIRKRLEFRNNPTATMIVKDKPVLVDVMELDIQKIIADKERGRIKSVTYGEFGPKIEIHDAHMALTNIARMHGLFEKDNEQQGKEIKVIIKKK